MAKVHHDSHHAESDRRQHDSHGGDHTGGRHHGKEQQPVRPRGMSLIHGADAEIQNRRNQHICKEGFSLPDAHQQERASRVDRIKGKHLNHRGEKEQEPRVSFALLKQP